MEVVALSVDNLLDHVNELPGLANLSKLVAFEIPLRPVNIVAD